MSSEIRIEAKLDTLQKELDATKEYAKEGWAWLDDALKALSVKTVFDIPKAEAKQVALREFAEAFKSWVDNDAPTEEWDGGTLGYEVGGLYEMATEALGAIQMRQ
jgi:hypothetical protein